MTRACRDYWEERARTYAHGGQGLRAVGSYGMPVFYNRCIDWTQWLALRHWFGHAAGRRVLDVGCGVGRWSRRMARAGASVVGVDRSLVMLEQARRRAREEGVGERCRFVAADLAELRLATRFELIFGVTVLQHILEHASWNRAVRNLGELLEPGGRIVLLEVAPTRLDNRCDSEWFAARTAAEYADAFEGAGLRLVSTRGVDPAPFKIWLLPRYRLWPRAVALPALVAQTAVSTPIDSLFGRALVGASWHKVFELTHA